jgi:hypothetical protein
MSTWAGRQHVSVEAADRTAEQLVADFSSKPIQRATRELIAEALRGNRPDLDQVRDQLVSILGGGGSVEVTGSGTVEVSPRLLIEVLEGRVSALDQLAGLDAWIYEWARFTCLAGTAAYAHEQPQLAADARFGKAFASLDHDALILRSCLTLLTTLGMAVMGVGGPSGSWSDPQVWRDRNLKGVIRGTHVGRTGLQVSYEVIEDTDRGSQLPSRL